MQYEAVILLETQAVHYGSLTRSVWNEDEHIAEPRVRGFINWE